MKTIGLKLLLVSCAATAIVVSCNNSSEEKVEKAKADVVAADSNLQQARIDSLNEYLQYKAEENAQLRKNDSLIADLKVKMRAENKETRDKYIKALDDLDAKNAKLKVSIEGYKESSKDAWQNFKSGFNKEVDDLGKSISALSNTKK